MHENKQEVTEVVSLVKMVKNRPSISGPGVKLCYDIKICW